MPKRPSRNQPPRKMRVAPHRRLEVCRRSLIGRVVPAVSRGSCHRGQAAGSRSCGATLSYAETASTFILRGASPHVASVLQGPSPARSLPALHRLSADCVPSRWAPATTRSASSLRRSTARALVILLVAGFGSLAKIGMSASFDAWIVIKLAILARPRRSACDHQEERERGAHHDLVAAPAGHRGGLLRREQGRRSLSAP